MVCPETSVRNCHYSLRNSPEVRGSQLLRGGSLKSRIFTKRLRPSAHNEVNIHPITGHESPYGESRYSSTLSLTSALDGVGGQRHVPAALQPGKRPGTHCVGDWGSPRAGLVGCGKSPPPPGFDPRTVQPVTSSYTD